MNDHERRNRRQVNRIVTCRQFWGAVQQARVIAVVGQILQLMVIVLMQAVVDVPAAAVVSLRAFRSAWE